MLVLSRKTGQTICIASTIQVTVLQIRGGQVKLGVSGPRKIPVHREEVYRQIHARREILRHGSDPRT